MVKLWEKQRASLSTTNTKVIDGLVKMKTLQKYSSETQVDKSRKWLDLKLHQLYGNKNIPTQLALVVQILPIFDIPVLFYEISEKIEVKPNNVTKKFLFDCRKENWEIQDVDVKITNPVEDQEFIISKRSEVYAYKKPNPEEERKILSIILSGPLNELAVHEKKILWKFKEWLIEKQDVCGLAKVLRCIDLLNEGQEARKMISRWIKIDLANVFECLGPRFAQVADVRDSIIEPMKKLIDDKDLPMYLLQLVQSLRYEKDMRNCKLLEYLKSKCNNLEIASKLYWYVHIETFDPNFGNYFSSVLEIFKVEFKKHSFYQPIMNQVKFCTFVKNLSIDRLNRFSDRTLRIKELHHILAHSKEFASFFPLNLPISSLTFGSVSIEDSTIFKSANAPISLCFVTTKGNHKFRVIFKYGDDLRQDQLVIQTIQIMDTVLQRNGCKLDLTPYQVLACDTQFGMIEAITPSKSIQDVINEGKIEEWFLKSLGTKDKLISHEWKEIMERYKKSFAGYCVITYIIGIGDRHLDNILLTPNGRFFHIDFGFILGNDPKSSIMTPPLIKVTSHMLEMIEGKYGRDSENFESFLRTCCMAYSILRNDANLIINLFSLMVHANIRDIQGHVGSDPYMNLMKLQERFQFDLDESEAFGFMLKLISESENSYASKFHDMIHKVAQTIRK